MAGRQAPFRAERYRLQTESGGKACLAGAGHFDAHAVAGLLARYDPWARLGIGGETLARQFFQEPPAAYAFAILWEDEPRPIGGVIVRHPWLLGPYLNLIGISPNYARRGIGAAVLGWLESEAQLVGSRNTWLCVSGFNTQAQRFYSRHGYREVATLDDLVVVGEDEILMRKRLEQAPHRQI